MADAHARYRDERSGVVADYIPALSQASPNSFGICVVGVHGAVFAVGDVEELFSIQSVSKPFVFALVCDGIGFEIGRAHV